MRNIYDCYSKKQLGPVHDKADHIWLTEKR